MFYISHCFIIHISNFVWFYSTLTFCWPELSTDAIRDTSLFCTYHYQTSYLSLISQILLVEKRLSCGEISAFQVWQLWGNWKFLHMWRNFRCLHMTDVEKSEIVHIGHVWSRKRRHICKMFAIFFIICHNIRAFMWRKIEPKSTFVEKKRQIWVWLKPLLKSR